MNLDLVKSIADAVLYEGYILYPYRASAVKNQQRFNFGVLVPRAYCEARSETDSICRSSPAGASGKMEMSPFSPHGGSETSSMRTECLIEGDAPVIDVRVRFLHLVSREVYMLLNRGGDVTETAEYQLVPALEVAGKMYHTWQEAVEREVVAGNLSVQELASRPQQIEFSFKPSETSERLYEVSDHAAGRLTRRQQLIQGIVTVRAESQRSGPARISVEIHNTTPSETSHSTRDNALMYSLVSTHIILAARGGQFVSLLDPPESFAELAAACRNVGTWPVLAGNEGQRDMMLSSPIILYDYPQTAPESGGDFFDGTEIDEMLALRVMTLTDEEKREMQRVDDRARQILERTQSLPPEHWQRLHGAIRGWKTNESR